MARAYIGKDGYRHYADSGTHVHRAVGRKKLGGTIYKGYGIHHRNENKPDNRPRNLTAVRHGKHARTMKKPSIQCLSPFAYFWVAKERRHCYASFKYIHLLNYSQGAYYEICQQGSRIARACRA